MISKDEAWRLEDTEDLTRASDRDRANALASAIVSLVVDRIRDCNDPLAVQYIAPWLSSRAV